MPSLAYAHLRVQRHDRRARRLAYALLGRAARRWSRSATRARPSSVRLSNLMAFDATVHGTWGCPPEAYPEVLRLIYDGKVVLEPFVERAPMSRINELLDGARRTTGSQRRRDPRSRALEQATEHETTRMIALKNHDLVPELRVPPHPLRGRARSSAATASRSTGCTRSWICARQREAAQLVHDRRGQGRDPRPSAAPAPIGARSCVVLHRGRRHAPSAPAATPTSTRPTTRTGRSSTCSTCGCSTTWSRTSCSATSRSSAASTACASAAGRRSAWRATSRSPATTRASARPGPVHGSAPDGGSTDFLHLYVGFAHGRGVARAVRAVVGAQGACASGCSTRSCRCTSSADGQVHPEPVRRHRSLHRRDGTHRLRRVEDGRRDATAAKAARRRVHGRPRAARRGGRAPRDQAALHVPRLHAEDAREPAQEEARALVRRTARPTARGCRST